MKVNSFRDPGLVRRVSERISEIAASLDRPIRLMEVCGTHTHSIFHYGIRELLPAQVELLSGPGCPVCVTPMEYIDAALQLARRPEIILTTFGDLMRVPGEGGSLLQAKAEGARIHVLYSPLESVRIAKEHPGELVVFLGVGFETTTPLTALLLQQARSEGVENIAVASAHKVVPPALRWLAGEELRLDGFILPGHVSAVIGLEPYRFLAETHGLPGVVAGFEPLEILRAILLIAEQLRGRRSAIENAYPRVVRPNGNPRAVELMAQFFQPADSLWRGLGVIPGSGLILRDEWSQYDIWERELITAPLTGSEKRSGGETQDSPTVPAVERPEESGQYAPCICGQILTGRKTPLDCPAFGSACQPETPVGACMVSSEGTCAAYYRYRRKGAKEHGR